MRKILFIMSISGVGGTSKSFIEFMKVFPLSSYEVHIGLLEANGPFMAQLPQGVIIHDFPPLSNKKTFLERIKSFHWIGAVSFLLSLAYGRVTHDYFWFCRNKYKDVPVFDECFDLAVSYRSIPPEFIYFLCNRVQAKVKCSWVHEDVAFAEKQVNYGMLAQLHPCLDRIFVVSEEAKQHFDATFPQMQRLTDVFHNVIPVGTILKMAEEGPTFVDGHQRKRLLTVGRVHYQKGVLMAIHTLTILLEKGYDVNWYFIGGNNGDRYFRQCMRLIEKEGLADHFILLGVQMNPYRFMQDCDVYVQPSLFESYCMSLAEALCFSNPIVTTCFCGAREQLTERANTYMTDISSEALAEGIVKALNDEKIPVKPVQKENDLEKLYALCQTK